MSEVLFGKYARGGGKGERPIGPTPFPEANGFLPKQNRGPGFDPLTYVPIEYLIKTCLICGIDTASMGFFLL